MDPWGKQKLENIKIEVTENREDEKCEDGFLLEFRRPNVCTQNLLLTLVYYPNSVLKLPRHSPSIFPFLSRHPHSWP